MWAVVAVLFGLSAAGKLITPSLTPWLLSTGMLPRAAVEPVARAVILLELLACVLLLWPRTRRYGWVLAGGLAGALLVIHAASALLGDPDPCPCFGLRLRRAPWLDHVFMAGLCLAVGLVSFVAIRRAGMPKDRLTEGGAQCVARQSSGVS